MDQGNLQLFEHVCVCRSFKLDGLQAILRQTGIQIELPILFKTIGDLNASGWLHTYIGSYIVDRSKAIERIESWEENDISLSYERYKTWRDWYQNEFQKRWKVEDLAELLYHEAACFIKDPSLQGDVVEYLKGKTKKYLNVFLQLGQSPKQSEEITQYITKFIKQLKSTELDRLEWILSHSEYEAYFAFLDTLSCVLSQDGYDAFLNMLNN